MLDDIDDDVENIDKIEERGDFITRDDNIVYLEEDDSSITVNEFDPEEKSLTEVGKISVDDGWLDHVEVASQRQGMGSKLIALAIERLGLDKIACVQEQSAYRFSLTPAGEMLIASCVRKKIVSKAMCIFSNGGGNADMRPPLEEGEGIDPGLDSVIVFNALENKAADLRRDKKQKLISDFFAPIQNSEHKREEREFKSNEGNSRPKKMKTN